MKYRTYQIDRAPKRGGIKWRFAATVATFLLVLSGWLYSTQQSSESSESAITVDTQSAQTTDEPAPHPLDALKLPSGVDSAVGTKERGVVSATEPNSPIPMASITKVVTALVILEKAPLELGEQGDSIELQQKDEDYYWQYAALEGTLTPVTAGYSMSQYEMLQTILLPSSNNIADTLTDYYFGGRDGFLHAAQSYLEREGLSDTRVVDATGFSPESVSTPKDLIRLGQLALQNDVIAEIVAQENASVSVAGTIPNYNSLITEPYVTGIKPGFTEEAGSCLLISADIPKASGGIETIIAVVMGAQDRTVFHAATSSILDQATRIYQVLP